MGTRRPRLSPLELVEQTLTEAEAGLARAIDTENSTAEANILSRLHTIRTHYAKLLKEAHPEDDGITDEEVDATTVALIPALSDAGVEAVAQALAVRRRRGRT